MIRRPTAYLLLTTLLVLAACGEEDNGRGASPSPTTPPEPTTAVSTPTEEATAEPTPTVEAGVTPTSNAAESGELGIEGVISGGIHGEVDGESYVFVMTLGNENTSGHGMLYVLEVGDEGALQQVGSIETPLALSVDSISPRSNIGFADGVVYLPVPGQDTPGGLWAVDVSNPTALEELSLVEMEQSPVTVAVSGDIAAVVPLVFTGEVQFFDISDPANPQLAGEQEFAAGSIPPGIALADSMFYVVSEGRVNIIDASLPDAPAETVEFANPDWEGPPTNGGGITGIGLDSIAPSDMFLGVAASGEHFYVAASNKGLLVVDVSDSANPEQVAQVDVPGRAVKAVASYGLVYVLGVDVEDGDERPALVYTVHIVDVSNPDDPQLVGSTKGFESQGPLSSLIADDDAFYLQDMWTLHVIERPQ